MLTLQAWAPRQEWAWAWVALVLLSRHQETWVEGAETWCRKGSVFCIPRTGLHQGG